MGIILEPMKKNQRLVCLLGIVLVFLIALYFSLSGVDYGPQWDQNVIKGFVNLYIRTGRFLPGWYYYPPVPSYVATTTIIPYAIPFVLKYGANWYPTQQYLLQQVVNNLNPSFLLNMRSVFASVTMLSIPWVGLAGLKRSMTTGIVAATLLGLSWELSYHSRIIAPDGLMVQAVALTLMFGLFGYHEKNPNKRMIWLALGGASAALAAASKYNAGISLLSVLAFALALPSGESFRITSVVKTWAAILAVFILAFIILVPGTLLETGTFIRDIQGQGSIYANPHGLQTVEPGWEHLTRALLYLATAAFSHNVVLAVFALLIVLTGAVVIAKERNQQDLSLFLGLVAVPAVYLLYLSTTRVMFVRNTMIVFPYLAVLGGIGLEYMLKVSKKRSDVLNLAILGGFIVLVTFNVYWLGYTSWTIQQRASTLYATQAIDAIRERPDKIVYITPSALGQLKDVQLPQNVTLTFTGREDLVLFAYRNDTLDEEEGSWPVNFVGAAPMVFGPMEINFDWYANWAGSERLVLATPDLALQDGFWILQSGLVEQNAEAVLTVTGVLNLDGEQFFIEDENGRRIYILNSANPIVILALRPAIDTSLSITGITPNGTRPNGLFLLSLNNINILERNQVGFEFHTLRLLSELSQDQRDCFIKNVGEGEFNALVAGSISLIDLPDGQLDTAANCLAQ